MTDMSSSTDDWEIVDTAEQQKLRALERELEASAIENTELKQKISVLEVSLRDQSARLQEALDEKLALETEKFRVDGQTNSSLAALEDAFQKKCHDARMLQAENESLRVEAQLSQQSRAKMRADHEMALSAARQALDERLIALTSSHERKQSELHAKISSQETELAALRAEVVATRQQHDRLSEFQTTRSVNLGPVLGQLRDRLEHLDSCLEGRDPRFADVAPPPPSGSETHDYLPVSEEAHAACDRLVRWFQHLVERAEAAQQRELMWRHAAKGKISVKAFEAGDMAFFVRKQTASGEVIYEAFNQGAPARFLSPDCVGMVPNDAAFVCGQIVEIESTRAGQCCPYAVPAGSPLYIVTAVLDQS